MIDRIRTLLALCALLGGAAPTAAAADGYPLHGGFAIGFAGADASCDYYGYNCDGEDTAFKVYLGKRWHENLAVELALLDFGRLDNVDEAVKTTADSSGINLSVHGIIPVQGIGYFYGKAGMMAWRADYRRFDAEPPSRSDDEGTDFTYGAGFAVGFGDGYELRFEFERLHDLGDAFTPGGDYVTVFTLGGTISFE